MKTSDQIDKIIPALLKAKAAFPLIVKTKTARITGDKANYEFKYAPLEEILHAVNPHLQEAGLMLMQGVDGFSLETTLFHESGQFISHAMEMPHAHASPRAFGSELTFRRRYSVTAVLNLAAEEDDDGAAAEREAAKKPKARDSMGEIPSAATGAAVKKDAFDRMEPKQQEFLRGIAANVIGLLDEKRDDDAHGYLKGQRLDMEEELGLAHLLDSKYRSALKRAGQRADLMDKATERNPA